MKTFAPDKIRNIALVGHTGSGKTTLAEALLYRAGAIARPGSVDDGSTRTDYTDEEHQHGMSIGLAMAPIIWNDHKINIIDTPGMADFEGEVVAAMSACDLAVFVVSAADGVEPNTERYWRIADRMALPRMIFLNKLDRDNASFETTLDQLRELLGSGVAPIELPIGSGSSFHGVADLFRDKAYIYDSGQAQVVPIPEDMVDGEHAVHDQLVEGIVVADDDLLTAFLDGDVPSVATLEATMARGVASAEVFPVVCGSAAVPVGVDRLADFICEVGSSPVDRPVSVNAGDVQVDILIDPDGKPLVQVFKTVIDRYLGPISLFKVLNGSVRRDDHLFNHRSGTDERMHTIFGMNGGEQYDLQVVSAGDIGAVAKLAGTETGDVLSDRSQPVTLPPLPAVTPTLSVALSPVTKSDDAKMGDALHRLIVEDPTMRLEQNPVTHETLLWGMGEMQLLIAQERLAQKFGVTISVQDPKVAYRQTFSRTVTAEGKHKKQSGGHGQYGVANVRFEPLPEGSGFEFVDATKGGSIPKQFLPAVERGVREAFARGGEARFPIVDVRAVCLDGKYHSVDSSEMAFAMAGRAAVQAAIPDAGLVVLEPLTAVKVDAPARMQGDVMGDLTARRGRVLGTETGSGDMQVISAIVPTAELAKYTIDLRSMTGGRGRHTIEPANYQELPANVAKRLTSA